MNADEKAILEYLRSWPHSYISGKEIARKVSGKRRYAEDRGWAISILREMVRAGTLETDYLGHFRPMQGDEKKKRPAKHVSPQILRILKSSGKSFEGIVIDEDTEEPPKNQKSSPPAAPGDGKH